MPPAGDGRPSPTSAGDLVKPDAERILAWLEKTAERPVTIRELAEGLGIRRAERRELQQALRTLVDAGLVYRARGRRYAAPDRLTLVVGRLRGARRGGGFVVPEDGGADLFIGAGEAGSAVDGDLVVARPEGTGRGGRPEGRIIRVLERSRRSIVGRFHSAGATVPGKRGPSLRSRRQPTAATPTALGWVVPEDPSVSRDVIAAASEVGTVSAGDVVVVRVSDWGDDHRGPTGVVERVLGPADAPGVDVLAIVHGHELPTGFREDAEREAEALRARGVRPEDLEGRVDFRDALVFTIDPADAKDHDDALSVREAGDGALEIGVHIADVSHYVAPGGPIDAEAEDRATSVYLVDRAIPMLPEALSSDLCSLIPDRDRLTLSVLFRVNPHGDVESTRILPSVIRSRHRLTYEAAQRVLAGEERIADDVDAALHRLAAFARTLRERRRVRGSLDFDLPSPRVLLDADGQPIAIMLEPRYESHRLVEDLMLLANEAVGQRAKRTSIPFLYRVHEPPDEVRLAELAELARAMGYTVPGGRPGPRLLQNLLGQAEAAAGGRLFSTLVLRSMKAARYCERDLGHFGLAAEGYTHFTSPIRRYPDLVVHRIVRGMLTEERGGTGPGLDRLAAVARHASLRERVAQEAERDSINLKKVRFMERHLGAVFDGTVSDVRPFGVFVLLDDHAVDGLIHVSAMGDDYYRWVGERFLLVGERTGHRFALGQRVRVRVAAVDVEQRRIDFVPEHGEEQRRAPRQRGSARRTKRRVD